MEQARGFFKKIINLIKKPELRILPGQLAFFLVLSLIPIVALIGTIVSFLSIPVQMISNTLTGIIPKEVIDIIASIISGRGMEYSFNMFVFFILAFVLASNGTNSMIVTSNEIYKLKSNNMIKRRLKAILMAFVLVMLFLFLLLIPIFGNTTFKVLGAIFKSNIFIEILYRIFRIIRYPLSIIILYINIKLLYVIAPDEKIESTTTTKGAIFTSIGWILASEIYSFYISNFARYSIFYGSISNVIILLLWVYILSYIFVIGMIINAGTFNETNDNQNNEIINQKKASE